MAPDIRRAHNRFFTNFEVLDLKINSGKACVIGEFSVRLLLKREILDEFSKTDLIFI